MSPFQVHICIIFRIFNSPSFLSLSLGYFRIDLAIVFNLIWLLLFVYCAYTSFVICHWKYAYSYGKVVSQTLFLTKHVGGYITFFYRCFCICTIRDCKWRFKQSDMEQQFTWFSNVLFISVFSVWFLATFHVWVEVPCNKFRTDYIAQNSREKNLGESTPLPFHVLKYKLLIYSSAILGNMAWNHLLSDKLLKLVISNLIEWERGEGLNYGQW